MAAFAGLDAAEQAHLLNTGNLPAETADHLIENFVGTMNIPVGIATNMRIDGRDRLVPMATEESSVVAAVCKAARQCYDNGGFTTSMSGSLMIAQIQLVAVSDPHHARMRILSNLADRRLARARCTWRVADIGGEAVRDAMVEAYHFADADPYRAATHNKGVMNGIDAVVLATGNDTRAVEAGAHAHAARDGHYGSLTRWEVTADGDLAGSIEIPMAVGLVGGATKLHPTAKLALKILDLKSADELARIIAAVGLAQNFSAIKALATTGIQKGHMALHAQNIAMMAGAAGEEIDQVARVLVSQGKVRLDMAEAELRRLRGA